MRKGSDRDGATLAVAPARSPSRPRPGAPRLSPSPYPAHVADPPARAAVLLVFAVAMIVLGTFVDSLAILLVFAPVAVELSKRYGIDPIQMGLVMVMCNQIGAVSPPTAPLLFVTTNIAQTSLDDTNRHVWTFFTAECLVLALVIFIPGLLWLHTTTHTPWSVTLQMGLYPFVIGDLLKSGIAFTCFLFFSRGRYTE